MLTRALKKFQFASIILFYGGPIPFLRHLKAQIYERSIFLGLEKDLGSDSIVVPCDIPYYLAAATAEDIEELAEAAKAEGKESAYELLGRQWYYESGFRDCYLARSQETDELCFIQYMIPAANYELIDSSFRNRLPNIREDEVWLENSYTFRKYRGKRVMSSILIELASIARRKGFRRMVTYIKEDNIASIKGCERAGFKVFERVPERKLLFLTSRKYNNGARPD